MRSILPLTVALIAATALAIVSVALADHVTCDQTYTSSHGTYSWKYTSLYNYTDWTRCTGSSYAIDCSRFDTDMIATWSAHDASVPIDIYFDNGTFSPYRKSGLYNNGTVQTTLVKHGNDNGSCN